MIEILTKPIYEQFYNLISHSDSTIKLCSPYVKKSMIKYIDSLLLLGIGRVWQKFREKRSLAYYKNTS